MGRYAITQKPHSKDHWQLQKLEQKGVRLSFIATSGFSESYALSTCNANRWFAQRYNDANAWNFNGNNGNLNNNNCTNTNQVQAVVNLLASKVNAFKKDKVMTLREKSERYGEFLGLMDSTRRNKRYGRDSVAHEVHWACETYRDIEARFSRTFRVDGHYAFLVSIPQWREIIATNFNGRMADHEVCDPLEPYFEQTLHPRTFNNRIGKGSQAAINQGIEDIYEVTEGFTLPARIIKWDLSGFFPNALCNQMEQCFIDVIEQHRAELDAEHYAGYADYLRWLTMICIHCNPAAHCELRTPRHYWREHIKPEKSVLQKPEGIGAPIGRLPSQKAMGLYINDEIRWLNDDCGIRATLFMDDCVMVVPEHLHHYALSLFPELRSRLAAKGVKLNERKFYDQPYQHGLEFLGSHIRPNRIHLNAKTIARCKGKIIQMNAVRNKEKHLEHFLASMNSYFGLLKNRTDYYKIFELMRMIDLEWWDYCYYNTRKKCISAIPSQNHKARLFRKYNINFKNKKKYEKEDSDK